VFLVISGRRSLLRKGREYLGSGEGEVDRHIYADGVVWKGGVYEEEDIFVFVSRSCFSSGLVIFL
jgi:hypothetical protein